MHTGSNLSDYDAIVEFIEGYTSSNRSCSEEALSSIKKLFKNYIMQGQALENLETSLSEKEHSIEALTLELKSVEGVVKSEYFTSPNKTKKYQEDDEDIKAHIEKLSKEDIDKNYQLRKEIESQHAIIEEDLRIIIAKLEERGISLEKQLKEQETISRDLVEDNHSLRNKIDSL